MRRDGRGHARELEVDLRRAEPGIALLDRGLGLPRLGGSVHIVLLGDGLGLSERPIAIRQFPRRRRICPRAVRVGDRLIDRGGIEPRINLVQRLALRDDRAFLEEAPPDQARDLRAHFRHLIGGYAAGKLGRHRDRTRLHHHEADFRRSLVFLLRVLGAAAGGEDKAQADRAQHQGGVLERVGRDGQGACRRRPHQSSGAHAGAPISGKRPRSSDATSISIQIAVAHLRVKRWWSPNSTPASPTSR